MPTPRSESIYKSVEGNTSIRSPFESGDLENKIDYFSVVAQVINNGVRQYLTEPPVDSGVVKTGSMRDLVDALKTEIGSAITGALTSEQFAEHFAALETSQRQRREFNPGRPKEISSAITAGTNTFVNSFTYIHDLLSRHFGEATASHPGNWRIADRIAKLEIHQFMAYHEIYLATFQNWSAAVEHLELANDDSLRFKPGYPEKAQVPLPVTESRKMLEHKDLLMDGSNPMVSLKDMPTDQRIGCPVTFSPDIIKELWGLYAHHAHRILTTPAVSTADDTEAFPR